MLAGVSYMEEQTRQYSYMEEQTRQYINSYMEEQTRQYINSSPMSVNYPHLLCTHILSRRHNKDAGGRGIRGTCLDFGGASACHGVLEECTLCTRRRCGPYEFICTGSKA